MANDLDERIRFEADEVLIRITGHQNAVPGPSKSATHIAVLRPLKPQPGHPRIVPNVGIRQTVIPKPQFVSVDRCFAQQSPHDWVVFGKPDV